MPWTERQRALLGAMGLRVWAPRAPAAQPAPVAGPPAATTARAAAAAAPAAPPRPGAGGAPPRRDPAPAAPSASLSASASVPESAPAPASAPAAGAAQPAAPAGSRAGIATLDWPALRATVAACTACALCHSRTQTVFGVGDTAAHWLVVGEAPGESEDLQGEPFVGAAGQLLDRMLAALQLSRSDAGPQPPAQRVYIANTLKCRPPRNRNPGADELAQCEPYLVRQIELLGPRIILAMGRYAAQALLRTEEPVGRLRGRVHRSHGVPVIVTYHPSYLLRSPPEKARAWEDLCLAAQVAEAAAAQTGA